MNADKPRGEDRGSRSTLPRSAAATFGLRSSSKIRDVHSNRLAMVCVRQSTPQQVLENRESRERQYALAQFAERLGWPAERVVVIDEDQGQSGKTAAGRSGFQRLMTEVSLNHVGIVLGLELSRLSRPNRDWHQLIDVCGIFNTLLCDQDAVYDPLDSNDRLLLGMRGAMSEYELVTLRNRLLRGSRNKAERGELFLHVPVGYLKTPSGEIVQEPDEQARAMVQLVFDKFEELASAYAVFRHFVANQFQLGFRPQSAARGSELEWRLPTPNGILGILRRPIYAGAYAHGIHRPGTKNPVTGRTEGGKWFVPLEEMPVLLRDRLPAYISWEQYLANQERLQQNRALKDTRGAPKKGFALLQGLIVCRKCGHRMSTRYKARQRPAYFCNEYWRSDLPECCGRITAATLDELVELTDVAIVWKGGLTTEHQVARPVGSYQQLKDYHRLTERIRELHRQGLHRGPIAAHLNAEGFAPPHRRGGFSESGVGALMRELGLVGEYFRDDLLRTDEWRIPDLARDLGVIPQKIHYWIKQGWIHSRHTPTGKHFLVWADKGEVRRLKKIAKLKNSWLRARHPNLIIPKRRPAR